MQRVFVLGLGGGGVFLTGFVLFSAESYGLEHCPGILVDAQ